jgi:hypothetical protein
MISHFTKVVSLFLVLVPGISQTVHAQGQLQVSADVRARAEYRHGFSRPLAGPEKPAFFIDQRSRIIFDYRQLKYAMKLSFQDVRVWGSQPQLVRDGGSLTALHESWGQIFFTDEFSFKIGRQEINLDDQRIFGAVDWVMQARTHDAAMLRYKKNDYEVQTGFAFNQDGVRNASTFYTVQSNYKALQYLWVNKDFKPVNVSVLFLNNGRQGGTPDDYKTYYSQTVGPRIGFKNERIRANATYYGQFGKEPDGATKIKASYLAFDISIKLNPQWSITPGTELLSGNNAGNTGDNRAFTPFYGTNHKFNGLMDYFYVGNHISGVGLRDLFTAVEYRKEKFNGTIRAHYFAADGTVREGLNNSVMNKKLGMEFDVVLQYRFTEHVTFDAGYSRFVPTETLIHLKGGDKNKRQDWAWVMVSIKPMLYKTPEERRD